MSNGADSLNLEGKHPNAIPKHNAGIECIAEVWREENRAGM